MELVDKRALLFIYLILSVFSLIWGISATEMKYQIIYLIIGTGIFIRFINLRKSVLSEEANI